jgi:hypothetical protein
MIASDSYVSTHYVYFILHLMPPHYLIFARYYTHAVPVGICRNDVIKIVIKKQTYSKNICDEPRVGDSLCSSFCGSCPRI